MNTPSLVIMAAGMGSRFGGLKQLTPVGKNGEPIIDFSLRDAYRAGFRHVVFIIKKEIEEDVRRLIEPRLPKDFRAEYVYQEIDKLPPGFSVPEGRVKPWGTGHAVLCAKDAVKGPFAVINADDYYGRDAFRVIFDFLAGLEEGARPYPFCMVGYRLENTLTDFGHVSRGLCSVKDGLLETVTEYTHIEKRDGGAQYTLDEGASWNEIPLDSLVSMNLWGFSNDFFGELEANFPAFLETAIKENPLKGEYWLPKVVNHLLEEEKATVTMLHSEDRWYGVTYKEDLPTVAAAIQKMQEQGLYE
ncbi:MAG: nucleotidyltransferase [Clostridiales bacterium]|nr:nucleotidyltransferase [Clostridiales bacterium]